MRYTSLLFYFINALLAAVAVKIVSSAFTTVLSQHSPQKQRKNNKKREGRESHQFVPTTKLWCKLHVALWRNPDRFHGQRNVEKGVGRGSGRSGSGRSGGRGSGRVEMVLKWSHYGGAKHLNSSTWVGEALL